MITQSITTAFKADILRGLHKPGDVYKIALFTSKATLSRDTERYGAGSEVSSDGYAAGGQALKGLEIGSAEDAAWMDWSVDPTWMNATITARGALIYNDTLPGKNAVAVLDFGRDVTSTAGKFTVVFPPAGAYTSIVRIN